MLRLTVLTLIFAVFPASAEWLPNPDRRALKTEPPAAPETPPDLILEPDGVFKLPANGPALIRSFVIPAKQLETPRHLQSLELLPGDGGAVQHAVIRLDLTSASRNLDARDKLAGFAWRPELASLRQPEALFTVWTPRASVSQAPLGTGWRVHPDADFVVTLHLKPNGKEREIKPMIACWFASAPIHHVLALRMANETIDIRSGAEEYSLRDSFTLPVDAKLHGIYPVANRIAETVRLDFFEVGPVGDRIFEIPAWTPNAQEDYRFAEPLELPAGSRLEMSWIYNNSAERFKMPRKVRWGPKLTDEVGEIYLQLAVDEERKAVKLAHAINRHQLSLAIERAEHHFDNDAEAHAELAVLYADLGEQETAVSHGRKAVELAPDSAQAHGALGAAYLADDFQFSAEKHLKKAADLNPNNAKHWFNLANVYLGYKVPRRAIEFYTKAAKIDPRDVRIANNLGTAYLTLYDPDEPEKGQEFLNLARKNLEKVVARYPRHSLATANLGRTLQLLGQKSQAIRLYQRAILLAPGMEPTLRPLIAQLEGQP